MICASTWAIYAASETVKRYASSVFTTFLWIEEIVFRHLDARFAEMVR